jgi:hypothetical protein
MSSAGEHVGGVGDPGGGGDGLGDRPVEGDPGGGRAALLVAVLLVMVVLGAGGLVLVRTRASDDGSGVGAHAEAGVDDVGDGHGDSQGDGDGGVGGEGDGEGLRIVLAPASEPDGPADVEAAADVVAHRAAALRVGDVEVDTEGDQVVVVVPDSGEVGDPDRFAELLVRQGELQFRPVLRVSAAGDPASHEPTPPDVADPGGPVTFEDAAGESVYVLGPALADGSVVESAEAEQNDLGMWSVALTLRAGAEGIDRFNPVAQACSPPTETCPTGQLAMVLDALVQWAPTIAQPHFERDEITISGGFERAEAEELALVLSSGAMPVALTPEVVEPPG